MMSAAVHCPPLSRCQLSSRPANCSYAPVAATVAVMACHFQATSWSLSPASTPICANTDLRHNDAFAAVCYQSRGGSWAAFTTSGFDARRGIPAELHINSARYWRYPGVRRGLAVISGGTGERKSPFGGVGDVELSVGLDAARTEIDQYESRSYEEVVANEDADDRNVTLRARADQAVAFHHVLSDAIVRTSVPDGRFKRVNRDRQNATGLELLANVEIEAVSIGAELTIQDTWLSGEAGVASEPEYQPDVVAGVSAGAWLPLGVRVDARGRYIGRQTCVNPETNLPGVITSSSRVDAETARSWRLRSGWLSNLEMGAAIDNISDAAIYDQCGLPQPGRTIRFQVRLRQ